MYVESGYTVSHVRDPTASGSLMKRYELLDQATSPDGTTLALYRHDGAYVIRVGNVELMSTRRFHSEERLAELACEGLRDRAGARVLIGGLGFGFTLRAALRELAPDARVVVAELVPAVVEWNRNAEYPLAAASLADPRVELHTGDVGGVLAESAARPDARFDAIMLDVDNGPDALTTAGNASLYTAAGVARAVAALRPGGCLAYWSAHPAPKFERALRGAGLTVSATRVRAHATAGTWHTLLVAR